MIDTHTESQMARDKIKAFARWLVEDYEKDPYDPYYVDEYLHSKVNEWSDRGS